MINDDRKHTTGYKIGYYVAGPLILAIVLAGIIRISVWIITGG